MNDNLWLWELSALNLFFFFFFEDYQLKFPKYYVDSHFIWNMLLLLVHLVIHKFKSDKLQGVIRVNHRYQL